VLEKEIVFDLLIKNNTMITTTILNGEIKKKKKRNRLKGVGFVIIINLFLTACSNIQKMGYPPRLSENVRFDDGFYHPYDIRQKMDKDVPEYPKTTLVIDF
jgi:hypothetical protein